MSGVVRNLFSGFPTRFNTKQAVQPQRMAGGLKVLIGLYYLCSENKGADQLHGYCAICTFVFACAKSRFSHDTGHTAHFISF